LVRALAPLSAELEPELMLGGTAAGNACEAVNVELRSHRQMRPTFDYVAGSRTLTSPATFTIPGHLAASEGTTGNQWSRLLFGVPGTEPVSCCYQGNQFDPGTAADGTPLAAGQHWRLARCHTGRVTCHDSPGTAYRGDVVAGGSLVAEWVRLDVAGATSADRTSATLTLEGRPTTCAAAEPYATSVVRALDATCAAQWTSELDLVVELDTHSSASDPVVAELESAGMFLEGAEEERITYEVFLSNRATPPSTSVGWRAVRPVFGSRTQNARVVFEYDAPAVDGPGILGESAPRYVHLRRVEGGRVVHVPYLNAVFHARQSVDAGEMLLADPTPVDGLGEWVPIPNESGGYDYAQRLRAFDASVITLEVEVAPTAGALPEAPVRLVRCLPGEQPSGRFPVVPCSGGAAELSAMALPPEDASLGVVQRFRASLPAGSGDWWLFTRPGASGDPVLASVRGVLGSGD
jgi:hypothetical protein